MGFCHLTYHPSLFSNKTLTVFQCKGVLGSPRGLRNWYGHEAIGHARRISNEARRPWLGMTHTHTHTRSLTHVTREKGVLQQNTDTPSSCRQSVLPQLG